MLSKPASWTRIPDGSHPETQTCYQENSVLEHAPLENPDPVVRCAMEGHSRAEKEHTHERRAFSSRVGIRAQNPTAAAISERL